MSKRLPLAERIKEGLREGIESARGERDDLVESRIDLEMAEEGVRRSVRKLRDLPAAEGVKAD